MSTFAFIVFFVQACLILNALGGPIIAPYGIEPGCAGPYGFGTGPYGFGTGIAGPYGFGTGFAGPYGFGTGFTGSCGFGNGLAAPFAGPFMY